MDGAALVGREHELAVLDEAIERATRGERAVVMLVGEPGIGKTRLLDEVARRVAAVGGRAAWGRTSELGLTEAYWPWLQIVRALATVDDVLPQLAQVDIHADASARLARFEDVVAFLARRAASASPLALLLDDAHAADPSSLQLLEHLVTRLDGLRIVVAIASRDGDATPASATMLARIQRGARRLLLGRLGRDEVATLVGGRGDAARVWELSEGNPLFVEELVAAAVEGTSQLPRLSSVRAVIADRIARLPAATANVLGAAAVVGRVFRASVAAEIAGVADHEIVARLAPAVRLGMVTTMTADRYRFSHALVAEVIADELEPSERARLHLRAAGILDRRGGDDASAIAHHLLAAGHLAAEAAVAAAERAAALASARLAFEDAAALLERALEALGLSAPGDRRRRVELTCALAEALQHAAQHERAVLLCDEVAPVARDLDVELFARVVLVRGLHYRYAHTDAMLVTLLREAVDQLGVAPDTGTVRALRARALARIAAAEQPAIDPQGPMATAREAIAQAATLGDRDRLDVLWTATSALVEYADPDELVQILDETLRLATALGDRVRVVHTLLRQCFNTLDLVDRNAFDLQLDQLRACTLALNVPRWIRALHLVDSLVASLEGRFADADVAVDAAIAAARGDEQGTWLIELHRALSAPARGLTVTPEQRALLFSYTPARPAFAAWIAALECDVAETREALAQIPASSRADSDFLPLVATAIALAGTLEQAESMYRLVLPRRGRIVVATMAGSTVIDLYDRILLVLATATQRWDAVDGHAADALAVARRLRSPVWAAWIEADWADALAARMRAGDDGRCDALRASAITTAERLDMPTLTVRGHARIPAPLAPDAASGTIDDVGLAIVHVGELWVVRGFGEQVHVKGSRGIEMLARLVDEPGREHHVLELAGATDAVDGGDAGEVLDPTARDAYRERLHELTAIRDEAEAWGDRGRAERAAEELEALTAELSRAVGIGGRARRVGVASERARSNVQRRLNHALQQIRAGSRRIGEHLAASVKTGTYCCYRP